jgi:hypothetical protein
LTFTGFIKVKLEGTRGNILMLLIVTQGEYGERIQENIHSRAPDNWVIQGMHLTKDLPPIIEEPERYIEELELNSVWDLVLFLGESPSSFSLVPEVARCTGVSALIAPVDDYTWLPLGLERQIRAELEENGVRAVFPRTFCTLVPVGEKHIDAFAVIFGLPEVTIEVEESLVTNVHVRRGAPCGSTSYIADELRGTTIENAPSKAGTLVQIFPCLASRRVERLLGDAPIHVAGHLAAKAVERALTPRKRDEG